MNIFPALDFLIEKIKSGNFLNNLSVELYPIFIHNPRPNIPLCLHLLSNQIIGNWPNMFNQTYWQQKLIRMLQEYISVNKNCLVFIILLELVGRGIYVPLVTLILALGFLFKKCLFFSFVLVPTWLSIPKALLLLKLELHINRANVHKSYWNRNLSIT